MCARSAGALDLIKYDERSVEAVGAYILWYFATCDPAQLQRWPSAASAASVVAASGGVAKRSRDEITGSGPDPLAHREGVEVESGACDDERFALRLLESVAIDMGYARSSDGGPNSHGAAEKLVKMLRRGELGAIFFDEFPPQIERRRRRALGLSGRESVAPSRRSLPADERRRQRRAERLGRPVRRLV